MGTTREVVGIRHPTDRYTDTGRRLVRLGIRYDNGLNPIWECEVAVGSSLSRGKFKLDTLCGVLGRRWTGRKRQRCGHGDDT
jgi:hypothetical protein